jgi:hypothetical protein
MRFLVDECTGPAVARWLRKNHPDVFSVYEAARGMDDRDVVQRAFVENRILIRIRVQGSRSITAPTIAAIKGGAVFSVESVGPAPTRTITRSSDGTTVHRLVL